MDAPRLRLQIADIHELLVECNAARLIYVKLLDDKELEEDVRKVAAERLEGLSTCGVVEAVDEVEPPDIEAAEVAPPEVAGTTQQPRRLPPGRKALGLTLVSFGAVSVGTSFLFATGTFLPSEVKDCLKLTSNPTCDDYIAKKNLRYEYEARDEAAVVRRRHVVAMTTLFAAGVAAVGTGVVVLLTGKRPVALTPTLGGAQLIARF